MTRNFARLTTTETSSNSGAGFFLLPDRASNFLKNSCEASPAQHTSVQSLSWLVFTLFSFTLDWITPMCSHLRHLYGSHSYCHTRGPSWIRSKAENLASSNLQDGATKWYYSLQEPTRPDQTTQLSFSFNVVRCPHPNCSPHQQSMCGVPPSQYIFVLCGVPPM